VQSVIDGYYSFVKELFVTYLALLWKEQVATQDQVKSLMEKMSSVEGIVFKSADRIFE
jgi:hypothetical protein